MEYLPLGGAQEVGASCGVLTVGGVRLLIDAGMRPAVERASQRLPALDVLDDLPPDALLITHAHIDHTGALPLVAARFPLLPIYATESTIALMRLLLLDSVRIMEAEQLQPDGETPLYTAEMVAALLERIIPIGFEQPFHPVPATPTLTVRYIPAGHILGAGMLLLDTPEGRVLHTGDVSVTHQRTLNGVALADVPQADVVICEGTYGDRTHAARRSQEYALVETVQAVVSRGGRVLIPAFAVGRAQEVLLILKAFRAGGRLAPVPIYVDGMVRGVNDVYQAQVHDLPRQLQNQLRNARRPLFEDVSLQVYAVTQGQRERLLDDTAAAVIISTSGMLTGGPAPHYARRLATRAQDAIIFTGYQDEESPGAALLATRQGESLTLAGHPTTLHCQVKKYSLSAHADAAEIQHLLIKSKPRLVVLVHGDSTALAALARRCTGMRVVIPANGEPIPLGTAGTSRTPGAISASRVNPAPVLTVSNSHLPPTSERLYAALGDVHRQSARPWTAVELGQCYYGSTYTPTLREGVEQALHAYRPYFARKRLGAQWVYLPLTPDVVARGHETLAYPDALERGAVIVAQIVQGTPRLGLVLDAGTEPHLVDVVIEGWKARQVPASHIQIVSGVQRPDLLALEPSALKAALGDWHRELAGDAVDQLLLWDRAGGAAQHFTDLARGTVTDAERVALALDLLQRGSGLWKRTGGVWMPRPAAEVFSQMGEFVRHHLTLAGHPGRTVQHRDGRIGTLTGRSRWGSVEVAWVKEGVRFYPSRTVVLGAEPPPLEE